MTHQVTCHPSENVKSSSIVEKEVRVTERKIITDEHSVPMSGNVESILPDFTSIKK